MLERLLIVVTVMFVGVAAYTLFRYLHLRRASQVTVAAGKPAILYFRSDACPPCATQGRFLQQLQKEFGDQIVIEKVDADVAPDVAKRYRVFTLPTTLVVDPAGTVKHVNYGLTDARRLAGQVRSLALNPTV